MKILKNGNKLILEYPSKKEMNLSFFRISEFSEGQPELQKFYTPDKWLDIWSTKSGNIKYFSYFDGHNVSKETIIRFSMVLSGNISDREMEIIKACYELEEGGYVIAMEEGDDITLKHELSHGLTYQYPEYNIRALSILNQLPETTKIKFRKGLLKMGYIESVLNDEMIAYLTAYHQPEFDECFKTIKLSEVLDATIQLNQLYDAYSK